MKAINDTEFSNLTAKGLALVDFGAEWCAPCKAMIPVLTKISEAYGATVPVYSIDTDRFPELAAKHGVMSLPTLLLFKNGAQVERIVGAVSEKELRKRLDPMVHG